METDEFEIFKMMHKPAAVEPIKPLPWTHLHKVYGNVIIVNNIWHQLSGWEFQEKLEDHGGWEALADDIDSAYY